MSKTKLANIFDNLSFVSYILFLTDDLIIKIGKQRLYRDSRGSCHIPKRLLISIFITHKTNKHCPVIHILLDIKCHLRFSGKTGIISYLFLLVSFRMATASFVAGSSKKPGSKWHRKYYYTERCSSHCYLWCTSSKWCNCCHNQKRKNRKTGCKFQYKADLYSEFGYFTIKSP